MLNKPLLAISTTPLRQSSLRRVGPSVPVVAAAASSQHRQMGWPWPFRNNTSGSKLQQLLEVATLFSHQPSPEALQDVKAALSESFGIAVRTSQCEGHASCIIDMQAI
jgi:hypothetical protein